MPLAPSCFPRQDRVKHLEIAAADDLAMTRSIKNQKKAAQVKSQKQGEETVSCALWIVQVRPPIQRVVITFFLSPLGRDRLENCWRGCKQATAVRSGRI